MGECVICPSCVISGLPQQVGPLMQAAMKRVDLGLHPHTTAQYVRQFKVFLAFVLYSKLESVHSLQSFYYSSNFWPATPSAIVLL